jgi:hypothetical protein
MEPIAAPFRTTCSVGSVSSPRSVSSTPPVSMPTKFIAKGLTGLPNLLTRIVENAWSMVLTSRASRGSTPPSPANRRSWAKMMTMPAKPSTMPAALKPLIFSPGRSNCANSATQNGKAANSTLPSPLATYCSAQYTSAKGTVNVRMASDAYSIFASFVTGMRIRLIRRIMNSTAEATRKRTPTPRNGGMLVRPILMASHVEPQTMEITARPVQVLMLSTFMPSPHPAGA